MFNISPSTSPSENGTARIEEQHRTLVSLLTRMTLCHAQGATGAEAEAILADLADCVEQHFRTVQQLLANANPALPHDDTIPTSGAGPDSERQLHILLDQLPSGVVLVDVKTCELVFANPRFSRMVGCSLSELQTVGRKLAQSLMQGEWSNMAPGEAASALVTPVRRKDGSQFIAHIERMALEFDGQPSLLAVFIDNTEYHHATTALKAERLRLQNVIDVVQAGTWEWDIATNRVHYDERTALMLGYERRDIQEGSYDLYMAWIHPDDRVQHQLLMGHLLSAELPRFEVELRMRHKSGHWVWVRTLGRVTQRSASGEPRVVAGVNIDIREQKTHHEQIEYASHYDALTGLPNRKLFIELLDTAMAASTEQGNHLAVAYIDLDGLAAVNEHQGREAGNHLMVEVGHRLARAMLEHQQVAHIGGDEFAVILSHLESLDAHRATVQRLLDVVCAPIGFNGLSLGVTASIGVTLHPQKDKVDAEQLLRQAAQAMYRAKLAGKNRYHLFDPTNDESMRERFLYIDEIRQGLSRGEFVLYYQPKVNMISGEVIGFEALIRWEHPQRGLVGPAEFIPTLDQHPVAITLGDWVINAALAQLARWNAQGLYTTVSVNIDRLQLQDPDFVARLQHQLQGQPTVQAAQLELEILETGALENMAHAATLINQLQGLGFECALDDFGTGYSSLTYLKQLTANTIKIDQSFVRGMLNDAEHAAIVNSVLDLSRNFDRETLAEGVETEAHGQALIEFGCEMGQGYAIARPMPASAVPGWVSQWRTPLCWARSEAVGLRDIPLLLAEVQLRAWMSHLHAFALGDEQTPPELAHNASRFGRWLARPSIQRRYRHNPEFTRLLRLHEQLHAQAQQRVSWMRNNGFVAAQAELQGLDTLNEELINSLRALRQTSGSTQWADSILGLP